jgi:predicted amidohydrolase
MRCAAAAFPLLPFASPEAWTARFTAQVRTAADQGASLVLFPEYVTAGLLPLDANWERWTELWQATTATAGIHTFNVTSLVKAALDQNLSTTVVAFRFQMDNDTSFTYGTLSNYNIIGFDAETIGNRPALTLEVMPITVGLFNVPSGDLPFSRRLI